MSHRPDWRVLATHDPIPGNASEIKDAASEYDRIRQAIADAQEALATVLSGDFNEAMISASVDEVKEAARTIKESLGGIETRYDVAAKALNQYADELDDAQTAADGAEDAAQRAQNDLDQANEDMPSTSRNSGSRYSKPIQRDTNDPLNAKGRISDARGDLNKAITKRNEAARDAAKKIRDQIDHDGLNDTWWENWGNKIADFLVSIAVDFWEAIVNLGKGFAMLWEACVTLREALEAASKGDWKTFKDKLASGAEQFFEAISQIAESIATICGTLALIFSFIPFPAFQAAAAILGGISRVAELVYIVVETGLAMKEGLSGEGWDRMRSLGLTVGTIVATTAVASIVGNVSSGIKSANAKRAVDGYTVEGVGKRRAIGQSMKYTMKHAKQGFGGDLLPSFRPTRLNNQQLSGIRQGFRSMGLSSDAAQLATKVVVSPAAPELAENLADWGIGNVVPDPSETELSQWNHLMQYGV